MDNFKYLDSIYNKKAKLYKNIAILIVKIIFNELLRFLYISIEPKFSVIFKVLGKTLLEQVKLLFFSNERLPRVKKRCFTK